MRKAEVNKVTYKSYFTKVSVGHIKVVSKIFFPDRSLCWNSFWKKKTGWRPAVFRNATVTRHIDFIIADMLQKNLNIDENIKLMFLLNLPIMWF